MFDVKRSKFDVHGAFDFPYPPRMLAFVHIPKTAGTTLHKIISHQYPGNRIAIHHDTDGPPTQELAARLQKHGAQVVMGHFSVGLHQFIPELRYVACLRNPVSRLTSHYHHALHEPTHYLHQEIVTRNLDLTGYISSGLSGELSNGMTRMLAGIEDFHHGTVDNQTLALAKSNIENFFDGVVLSESFDSGLLMLAESLNWKTPYYLRRKVGHYPTASRPPDHRTQSIIEEHNRQDVELYSWAKDRFELQASSFPDLSEQTRCFQQSNHLKGKAIFCMRELRRRFGIV